MYSLLFFWPRTNFKRGPAEGLHPGVSHTHNCRHTTSTHYAWIGDRLHTNVSFIYPMCRLLTKQNINEIAKCTIKKSGGSVFVSSHPIRSHSHDSTSIAMLAPVNLFIPTAIKHRSGNRFPKMEGRFNLQWPLCLPCLDTHCAALKIASLISTPQLDQFTMEEVIHSASSTNQIKDPHACNIPEVQKNSAR